MENQTKGIQKTQGGKELKTQNGKLQWLPVWNSLEISASEEITAVVKTGSPQLHEFGINEKLNEREGVLLLRAKIIFLVKFNGADWDKDMVNEAAKIAYQEVNWMTVAELKYFINRMAGGKYPTHKNFTAAIFMECLNSFINETLSTRGAVNSYSWRDNKVPDELFEVPANPDTGEVKIVDPDVMKKTLANMAEYFKDAERRMQEEDRIRRKEEWRALRNKQDQQIVNLVEHDAEQGIAPDKYMMKSYFEALDRLAGK